MSNLQTAIETRLDYYERLNEADPSKREENKAAVTHLILEDVRLAVNQSVFETLT